MSRTSLGTWVSVFLLASVCAAGVIDDFNRPDAGDLGPAWTTVSGGIEVIGNQARALNAVESNNLAIYNGFSGFDAYMDVFMVGNTLQFAGLLLGYQNAANNFFIKVQGQQGINSFTHYAFYYGGNSGIGLFGALTSPFTSGRIRAFFSTTGS